MGVTKKPETFETSDGTEFVTEEQAKKHQAVMDALEGFKNASKTLRRVSAEAATTADGKLFEFGSVNTYWYVSPGYHFPELDEVRFYGSWHSMGIYLSEEGVICIASDSPRRKDFHYPINELYADKIEAQKAWVAAMRTEIANHEDDVRKAEEIIAKKTKSC